MTRCLTPSRSILEQSAVRYALGPPEPAGPDHLEVDLIEMPLENPRPGVSSTVLALQLRTNQLRAESAAPITPASLPITALRMTGTAKPLA
jgi:hypothetical protein